MAKKEDVLRKVAQLLAKAESTGFDAEREALLKKADDLMMAYAIESWELDKQRDPNKREAPESRMMMVAPDNSSLYTELADLHWTLVRHLRCEAVYYGLREKAGRTSATVYGYPSDLDYLEMLYASLQLQMLRDMEPKPSLELSLGENCAMMREAGLKWQRAHELFVEAGLVPNEPYNENGKRHGRKYQNAYRDYCKEEEQQQVKANPTNIKRNFALGFAHEISNRLYRIRAAREKDEKGSQTSTALVLVDRSKAVKDMMEAMHPKRRTAPARKSKLNSQAFRSGTAAGSRADLSGGRGNIAPRKSLPS